MIEAVAAHYADAAQDRLDGLTVDLGDWWFNLRPSNTEPLLRLNLEAADRDGVRPARRRGPGPDRRRCRLGLSPTPEEYRMALDPQLLEILACPEDKGPLLYFADEAIALQPAPEAPLRDPRRHPDHADRRGRPRSTTPSTTACVAKAEADGISPTFEA